MVETYKQLAQRQIPITTPGLVYSPASGKTAIIRRIVITNPSGADATVRLYHINSGGTNNDASTILPPATVVAGGWAEGGEMVMDALDELNAVSGTNNVLTITVYGMEIS